MRVLATVVTAAVLSLAAAAPAAAATFVVNSTDDQVDETPGDGVCEVVVDTGVCTLRAAIMEANALAGDDEITILPGLYLISALGEGDDAGDFNIYSNLVITGAGAAGEATTVIDADFIDRVFFIEGGAVVTLAQMRLRNGIPLDGVGGILGIDASNVTLQDVMVTGGLAELAGGGIAVQDSSLQLNRVVVSHNMVVFGPGGGIANAMSALTIESSSFDGNVALCGGGIDIDSDQAVTITNSTFTNNQVGCEGGGLLDETGIGSIEITHSTFAFNTPENLVAFNDNLVVTNSLFVVQDDAINCVITPGEEGNPDFNVAGNFAAGSSCATIPPTLNAGLLTLPIPATNVEKFYLPLAANPVINGGDPLYCATNDQRGVLRPQGAECDSGAVEVTAAAITSGAPAGAAWNVPYLHQATGVGEGSLTFAIASGALPAGLTLDSDGTITGTPTGVGDSPFTITAIDAIGQTATQATSITVTGAPLTLSGTPPAATRDTPYAFPFTAAGNGLLTFSTAGGSLPAGLSLSPAGVLTGTPTVKGTFTFLVQVQDQAAQQAFLATSVFVAGPPLVLSASLATAHQGTPYSFAISASGDGAITFSVVAGTLPPGLALSATGVLSGTPTTGGSFGFSIRAVDASAQEQTVACTLVVNTPPTITGLSNQSTPGGTPVVVPFTVGDDLTSLAALTIAATSSNDTLLTAGGISIGGSGAGRTLTLTPIAGADGQATVTVTVNDGVLTASASLVLNVDSTPQAPAPPTGLRVTVSGVQATFLWTPPVAGAPPSFYVLEVGSVPGSAGVSMVNTQTTVTTWTLTLPPSGYFARVRSANGAGLSDPSNEVAFAINSVLNVPGPPRGLVAQVNSSGLVTITWARPMIGGAPTQWQADAGTAPGASDVGSFILPPLPQSASGTLVPGEYVARLRGLNAFGLGALSNEVRFRVGTVTCSEAPAAPVMLTPMIIGWTATLSWVPPANAPARTYRVLVGSAPGLSDLATLTLGSVSSHYAQGPPGTYYVSVVATNDCGTSPPSNSVTAVIGTQQDPPLPPGNVRGQLTGRTVRVMWDASAGAGSYVVEAGGAPGAASVATNVVGQTELVVPDVPPGAYYVRVRAVGNAGASAPSSEFLIIVP